MNSRVEALFHQLADLTADQRKQYFAEHAIGEETRREVEALLEFDSGASARLQQDVGFVADRLLVDMESRGALCGPYRLREVIGRGGMGVVYLAERVDGEVSQRVAVKLLPMGAGDPHRERFLQERQILATLSHPNIARMLDAGHLENGQPYLAMEYIQGERIDQFAASLGLRHKIELFLKVCAAVSYLHRNLIVHRDLKPANILVTADGEPKILDFGIAKLLDLATDTTKTSLRMLTPDYASPEQVTGARLTTTADIYSLGAVLYRLLTGKPAHEFDGESLEAIAALITTREPTRPSQWAPELKGDLEIILMKAMRKEPQERYPSVERFAEDLTRHLRHEPITARPDSLLYRARKFAIRHRAGVAAGLTTAIALSAGSGIAVWQARESARQRDLALAELRRAEATNDFSSYLLAQARPSTGKAISNTELLARGEALINTRFAADSAIRIHLLLTLADRYFENQQFAERARILQQAYNESRSIGDAGIRSVATCQWASQVSERGDHKAAVRLLDEVLPFLTANQQYVGFESQCRLLESMVAHRTSDIPRAIAAAERALLLEERRGGLPGRVGDVLGTLANAYAVAHRYQDANRAFEQWVKLVEAEGRTDDRDMAVLLNNWSALLQNAGQMLQALPLAERAIQIARSVDSEHGANTAMLTTYGRALGLVGHYADADQILDESIRKSRDAGSPARYLTALRFAIEAACEAGNFRRAAPLLSEAYAVLKADASSSQYLKGIVDLSASSVALESGDNERALELAWLASSSLEPLRVSVEILLARILNAMGRFQEALAAAEKGVSLWTSRSGGFPHSYWAGKALLEVASAKAGLGDIEAARNALTAAIEHTIATAGPKSRVAQRAEALRQQLASK